MSFMLIVILMGLLLIALGLFFIIFGIVKKKAGFIIIGSGMVGLCVMSSFALLYLITSM